MNMSSADVKRWSLWVVLVGVMVASLAMIREVFGVEIELVSKRSVMLGLTVNMMLAFSTIIKGPRNKTIRLASFGLFVFYLVLFVVTVIITKRFFGYDQIYVALSSLITLIFMLSLWGFESVYDEAFEIKRFRPALVFLTLTMMYSYGLVAYILSSTVEREYVFLTFRGNTIYTLPVILGFLMMISFFSVVSFGFFRKILFKKFVVLSWCVLWNANVTHVIWAVIEGEWSEHLPWFLWIACGVFVALLILSFEIGRFPFSLTNVLKQIIKIATMGGVASVVTFATGIIVVYILGSEMSLHTLLLSFLCFALWAMLFEGEFFLITNRNLLVNNYEYYKVVYVFLFVISVILVNWGMQEVTSVDIAEILFLLGAWVLVALFESAAKMRISFEKSLMSICFFLTGFVMSMALLYLYSIIRYPEGAGDQFFVIQCVWLLLVIQSVVNCYALLKFPEWKVWMATLFAIELSITIGLYAVFADSFSAVDLRDAFLVGCIFLVGGASFMVVPFFGTYLDSAKDWIFS